MTRALSRLPTIGTLPSFIGATEWLNSKPITPKDLEGNVVLVGFWTYTCINWLRTLPYLRAWAEKYKDHGLVVVGVHTPEFSFEHNIDNVLQAVKRFDVSYPVAIDNHYKVWTAFDNHYWPALYFVDGKGNIRYQQFGEGEYEMAERIIQELLVGSKKRAAPDSLVSVNPKGAELAADWDNLHTPETYLGYGRGMHFASPEDIALGRNKSYTFPEVLRLNQWALQGDWTIAEEAVVLEKAGGKIAFRFHARDLNLVMGPLIHGMDVPFHITLDQGNTYGTDVAADGDGIAEGQRLYQLIRQTQPIADRQFDIEFEQAGIEVAAFTFG